eukprot:Nk52_evm9s310 gene=Nk52_evmTU9s310
MMDEGGSSGVDATRGGSPPYVCVRRKTLGKTNDAYAQELLKKIADQVSPIMAKRKWKVALLSEFYPRDSRLLGLNITNGSSTEIRVRLRQHFDEAVFYPYEDLLGTMLHELTHIVRSPHDKKFYEILDELRAECEDLIAKGIHSSAGSFNSQGTRLGGLRARDPRSAAVVAAEKRKHRGALMGGPANGRKLGGSLSGSLISPGKLRRLAATAAERRALDNIWCGSGRPIDKTETTAELSRQPNARATRRGTRVQTSDAAIRTKGTSRSSPIELESPSESSRKPKGTKRKASDPNDKASSSSSKKTVFIDLT